MKGKFLCSYLLGSLEKSSHKSYPCGIHKTSDEDGDISGVWTLADLRQAQSDQTLSVFLKISLSFFSGPGPRKRSPGARVVQY
jgi:hypothetical protein